MKPTQPKPERQPDSPIDPLSQAIADRVANLLEERIVAVVAETIDGARQRPTLIRGKELAHAIGVSPAQVSRLKASGMPHVMIGSEPRYSLDECLTWLRSQRGAA